MHLGTRSLTLTIDGVPRTADVSDCRIVSGPMPTERRLLGGPFREYRLQCTAAQDPSVDSLWDLVWSREGQRIDIDLRPAGGDLHPTDQQPWFVGTVTITEPDGDLLGGSADPSPLNRFTFGIDWAFTDKPERLVQ